MQASICLLVLEHLVKREFDRVVRYRTALTVVFLEVNDFKMVNDLYGHDASDDVLKYVATQLLSMTRVSDVVARFAGDEFIVILPNTRVDEASEFTTRLQTFFINHPLDFEGTMIRISVSYGLSHMEDGADDAVSLLKKAEKMIYRAKMKRIQDIPVYKSVNSCRRQAFLATVR